MSTRKTDAARWGAQVIALGEGKFTLVGYEGGLPGDGWKRGDRREMADGKTEGTVTRLQADRGRPRSRTACSRLSHMVRNPVGKLKKVERKSPTLGAKPPQGAIVLFDGSSVDNFEGAELNRRENVPEARVPQQADVR